MRWTSREIADPVTRLRRLLTHGKRWCAVYWRQVFAYEGRTVNVATLPLYFVQQVERGELTIAAVAKLMADRSGGGDAELARRYLPLWDEAVTYVVGMRQDVLRASAAAEFAVALAARGQWLDAFRAATIAYDLEFEHAGCVRYWHPFLYSLGDVLIRLGHARTFTALRHLAQATPRAARPRPV